MTSIDLAFLGGATGADLVAQGIEELKSPNSAAQILTFIVQ